ncbi:hypothetical protein HYFRA_00004096 [Hymenoscyphus fraxineus]|uniref:Uncharacterized protein n=1 Tax=Hymenoscyphus fraxineus TaxID=746836 RepID=A0A9N9KML8_9HELO|nr:hypothetical protein HYFRA_00004096 [Hymenoscyphus fraxineus]
MHSTTFLGLMTAALMPLSTLACGNYRAEMTKDGDPNEPSISKIRVEWEDDCRIFCGTDGQYIESTSDNEWIVPCRTNEVILVVKDRGNTVEFRRNGGEGNEENYSFNTKSLTESDTGGKLFAHNPYCPPLVNGFLVAGGPIPWPKTGWQLATCPAPPAATPGSKLKARSKGTPFSA